MSLNVKHNKIKNTAILYELLSRQITVDVLNGTEGPKSVTIFKEFFNKKTEMGKEYELYSILLEKKYKNDSHASQLVEAVVKSRRKLSNRRLNNEKYNLIKTIKENYDINDLKKLLENKGQTEISLIIHNKNKKIYYNLQNSRKFDFNHLKAIKSKEYVKKITV